MYRLTKEYVTNAITSTYKNTNNNMKKRIDTNGEKIMETYREEY